MLHLWFNNNNILTIGGPRHSIKLTSLIINICILEFTEIIFFILFHGKLVLDLIFKCQYHSKMDIECCPKNIIIALSFITDKKTRSNTKSTVNSTSTVHCMYTIVIAFKIKRSLVNLESSLWVSSCITRNKVKSMVPCDKRNYMYIICMAWA